MAQDKGSGLGSSIGFGFQSANGAIQATSLHWLAFTSETLKEDIPPLESGQLRSRFNEPRAYQGQRTVGGDIVMEADAVNIGAFLHAAFGLTETTSGTGKKTHLFSETGSHWSTQSPLPAFSCIVNRDQTSAVAYYDLQANQLTLDINNGELVKATLGVVGGGVLPFATMTESYHNEIGNPKMTTEVASVEIGGAAVDYVSQLQIQLLNNLEARPTLTNSVYTGRVIRSGFRQCRVSGTFEFESFDEYDKWRANSTQTLEVTVGASADLYLKVQQLRYDDFPNNVDGPGRVQASFTARGEYDEANSEALHVQTIVWSSSALGNAGWDTYGGGTVA